MNIEKRGWTTESNVYSLLMYKKSTVLILDPLDLMGKWIHLILKQSKLHSNDARFIGKSNSFARPQFLSLLGFWSAIHGSSHNLRHGTSCSYLAIKAALWWSSWVMVRRRSMKILCLIPTKTFSLLIFSESSQVQGRIFTTLAFPIPGIQQVDLRWRHHRPDMATPQ